jgi:hypothetical protein
MILCTSIYSPFPRLCGVLNDRARPRATFSSTRAPREEHSCEGSPARSAAGLDTFSLISHKCPSGRLAQGKAGGPWRRADAARPPNPDLEPTRPPDHQDMLVAPRSGLAAQV